MKKITIAIFCLFLVKAIDAQILYSIGTQWDDSFKEWTIYTTDEDEEGDLTVRWAAKNDYLVWDYRIGEESGSIQQKWLKNPSFWELRGGNEIVTMQMKWTGDITEWRIKSGNEIFTLSSKYKNNLEEWSIQKTKLGHFQMYTSYEGDPRDWEIVDELAEEISIHIKMAMTFIVLYHSTPKY